MHEANYILSVESLSEEQRFASVLSALDALIADEHDLIANCANAASLIGYSIPNINWFGFYFTRQSDLVLGPFHGKPACTRIAAGKGVCGRSAASAQTLVVDDVHTFEGHIACDPASRSEIVVPLLHNSTVLGVLDCDSPQVARFSDEARMFFEAVARLIISRSTIS